MSVKKIVLCNSVGKDDLGYYIIHSPSRWSEGVKLLSSWFCYYPWELAYTSSLLKQNTDFEIKLLDPCLKRWNKYETLEEILKENPTWLIMESSTRTINENLWVLKKLKQNQDCKTVLVGQHASAFPEKLIQEGIDYACIGEYEYTVLELIQGKNRDDILGVYPNPKRNLIDFSQLPWPEDQDIKRIEYGNPGEPSSEYLEVQAYASRGCWGNCNFCVARNVYYSSPRWRKRRVDDIVAEIKYLKEKYPQMEGIFFDEENHNGEKDFIRKLTTAFIKEGLVNLRYEAMCDVRYLDEEVLDWMKSAGYYKIRFGIETASSNLAKKIGKPIEINRTINLLRYAKKIALKTYGTFMLGLPYSDKKTDLQTINLIEFLIKERLLNNVQISAATPLPGTPFYSWARKNNYLITDKFNLFDGGNSVIVDYPWYKKEEIEKNMELALTTRDHLFFKINILNAPGRFFYSRFKKYGPKLILEKILRRLKTEIKYFKSISLNLLLLIFLNFKLTPAETRMIILPKPKYKGVKSLEEVIAKRKSVRNYKDEPLSLEELSQLLWATNGISLDGITSATRVYPSAGAIYGIQIYLVIGNVTDVIPGIYKYQPREHQIFLLKEGDFRRKLTQSALGQRMIIESAVTFIFTADPRKFTFRYGKKGIRYMYIDLGHSAQNLYLESEALNLGTVAIGAFQDKEVAELLNLKNEVPLYLMPVGKKY